jgi:LCP family protein required for cell wall assembly
MPGQFKKPFPLPEEPGEKAARASFIAGQDTVEPPAVRPSAARGPFSTFPPPGYVQGRHGRYGVPGAQQTNQLFPGADAFHMPGQGFSGMGASGQTDLPTGNSLFPVPQTPGQLFPLAGGPAVMPGMGGIATPNPAWSGRPGAGSDFSQKEAPSSQKNKSQRRQKKRRVPIWARIVIGFLTFLLLLGGGSFWYYQANIAPFLNSVTGQTFTRAPGEEDPNASISGSILSGPRINILLLGSDTDEKPVWGGHSFLAQTVIVVTVDPASHSVGMLSIPRDYWINIPGYGMDKLDTAFSHGGSLGQNNNMSGVSEVVLTLDRDFGIPINAFSWVGLNGFIKVIDTVGGVDVNVMHPIVDDSYPDDIGTSGKAQFGYKRLYIPDGPQHLDGPTALEYVRSRHSTNDFDRSARQQQVLSALKLKLNGAEIISQLPQLMNDLKGYVYTSLKINQLLDLGNFARGLDPNKIQHLTLGGSLYTSPETIQTPYGTVDALQPKCDAIVPAINAFLHIHTAKCNISANAGEHPGIALATPATPGGVAPASSSNSLADASGPVFANPLGDLFGLRDLIDLVSMVVLDSPQA